MKFEFELLHVKRQILYCARVDRPVTLVCSFVTELDDGCVVFGEVCVTLVKPIEALNISKGLFWAQQDWEDLVLHRVDLEIVDFKLQLCNTLLKYFSHFNLARLLFKMNVIDAYVTKLHWGKVDK